jgi:hypothetical protein
LRSIFAVVNCIGGVQALFPLLETAASGCEDVDIGYLSLRDSEDVSRRNSVELEGAQTGGPATSDWEMLPSSSFSDWKLEQNAISGFLTLIRNLVSGHTINAEQLMRGGGVAIIGSLLQTAQPKMIDVNVLMASQLLVELAQASPDHRLLYQIYHSILFNFKIWSRAEVRIAFNEASIHRGTLSYTKCSTVSRPNRPRSVSFYAGSGRQKVLSSTIRRTGIKTTK